MNLLDSAIVEGRRGQRGRGSLKNVVVFPPISVPSTVSDSYASV